MDKPPPDDFDPSMLIDEPEEMQRPTDRKDERHQGSGPPDDQPKHEEVLLPMLHMIPSPLRKLLFTGSCCVGVAALWAISAWDHGLLPGFSSQFADANEVDELKTDMSEMIIRSLAREIRDLSADNCTLQSKTLDEHLESLRRKYEARTGGKYPHSPCKEERKGLQ